MANYKVIGVDQRVYSSVTEEQLRGWITEGRANAQTRVQVEGSEEWKMLSEFPEFASALGNATPPPMPAAATTAPKISGMAITSLVLGILGIATCGITVLLSAPIGLILGIVAMNKIGKNPGRLRGKGLALAGIITSSMTFLLIPITAAMLLPALASAKSKAQEINCINNERQMAVAIKMYSDDNNGQFPPAAKWCDEIKTTIGSENVFRCPAANPSNRCDYAFNAKLGGLDVSKVDPQTVMIFESDTGWDANGGPNLMISLARHKQGRGAFVVAFADGSVRAVPPSELDTLHWNP